MGGLACFLLGALVGFVVALDVVVCFACIAANGRRADSSAAKRETE